VIDVVNVEQQSAPDLQALRAVGETLD